MSERRRDRILHSAQWRGGTFGNTKPVGPMLRKGSQLSTIGKFIFGGERRVPKGPLPSEDPRTPWRTRAGSGLRATWLGHSTVLLEIDGLRVLTDPVWGLRASPSSLMGPRRFQPAPVAIDELPPLDAIVISHDHYDHLCEESVRLLALHQRAPFVTSLGVGARLEKFGIDPRRIIELDWWEAVALGALTITAAPSQHFSGRGIRDRNSTLWSSLVMRGPRHAVFFSGDTGLTEEYTQIKARLGPFDLVMLEIGAFDPSWGDIHLGPENAIEALRLLGGGAFLPVHWGTFNLGLHAWDDPAETLVRLAPTDLPLVMPKLGVPTEPSRIERVDPWWRALAKLDRVALPIEPTFENVGEPID